MSKISTDAQLESSAWLLSGLTGSSPGALSLAGGRLTYRLYGVGTLSARRLQKLGELCGTPDLERQLEVEEEGVSILDEPVEAVELSFPWYTFGGGMTVETKKGRFRFSFLRPANTMAEPERGVVAGLEILTGRAAGRRWRELAGAGRRA